MHARGLCKKCYNAAYMKQYRLDGRIKPETLQKARENHRHYHRRHRYGLEPEDYEAMIERQDGRFAICQREARLVVDHNHTTGKVRGLLCDGCNHAIGYLETWIPRFGMERFENYLDEHRDDLAKAS